MLLERGPIDPIDVDAQFRASSLPSLVSSTSSLASSLAGAQAALGAQLATMASDDGAGAFTTMALELGALSDELARQAGALDPSIGDVAAAAGDQGAQLPGLTSDVASDLTMPDPEAPDYASHPPDPEWGDGEGNPPPGPNPTPPPGGTVADLIIRFYGWWLRREASLDEINGWSKLWPNQDAIEHGILYSNENANKVNGLYQQYFDRDVTGDELAEHRARKDTLDEVEDNVRSRA